MKKFLVLITLAAIGYYLYTGPLATMVTAGRFPLKVLKSYEDELLVFDGPLARPKADVSDDAPSRRGKVVVVDSQMHMQPRLHKSFHLLDLSLQAADPKEVETVIFVHFVPSLGAGAQVGKAPHRLYWMSFDWTTKQCLGRQLVKTWPSAYSVADTRAEYPDFVSKVETMNSK